MNIIYAHASFSIRIILIRLLLYIIFQLRFGKLKVPPPHDLNDFWV